MADVPIGTTIAFATSALATEVTEMTIENFERTPVPVTHYGSTATMEYIPARLSDTPEITFTVNYDSDEVFLINAVAELITVTLPVPPGGSTPATFVGTGFVTSESVELGDGEDAMTRELTVKYDGRATPFAFTAST